MTQLLDSGMLGVDDFGNIQSVFDEKVREEISQRVKEAKEIHPDIEYL